MLSSEQQIMYMITSKSLSEICESVSSNRAYSSPHLDLILNVAGLFPAMEASPKRFPQTATIAADSNSLVELRVMRLLGVLVGVVEGAASRFQQACHLCIPSLEPWGEGNVQARLENLSLD